MPSAKDAIALKEKGNKAVAAHEWLNAVDFYTQAIEINDKDPTFYCNRAQASDLTVSGPMSQLTVGWFRPISN